MEINPIFVGIFQLENGGPPSRLIDQHGQPAGAAKKDLCLKRALNIKLSIIKQSEAKRSQLKPHAK